VTRDVSHNPNQKARDSGKTSKQYRSPSGHLSRTKSKRARRAGLANLYELNAQAAAREQYRELRRRRLEAREEARAHFRLMRNETHRSCEPQYGAALTTLADLFSFEGRYGVQPAIFDSVPICMFWCWLPASGEVVRLLVPGTTLPPKGQSCKDCFENHFRSWADGENVVAEKRNARGEWGKVQ
jgi:hypothetical protein